MGERVKFFGVQTFKHEGYCNLFGYAIPRQAVRDGRTEANLR